MNGVDIVSADRAKVGESAWWDETRQKLWSVDIQAPALCLTDPVAGTTERTATPELAGGIVGIDDGRMLLALQTGVFILDPESRSISPRFSAPDGLPPTHRFNDVTVDPAGRLIAGTMKMSQIGSPEPTGTLYSFDGRSWAVLAEKFFTINGLAFSPDGRTLYYSDSSPDVQTIWSAPYDVKTGVLGERRMFVDMREHRGRPDGAATDSEGGYWIAAVGGGCVHRFLPDGSHDRTIDLPVEHPTKPAFGGAGLDTLYVTSLSVRPSATNAELAGAIVRVRPDVCGMTVPPVRLT